MEIMFHGGAREVGGSCVIVKTENAKVALDYGIRVEKGLSYDVPRDLDAVVITHAHLDHSGNLLTLADGNTLMVGSEATRDVTSELLVDLIKVQRANGNIIPYNHGHVNKIRDNWIAREKVALPGMDIALYPAGHVLGARMALLKSEGKKVLYTGDFCLHNTEILDGVNANNIPKEPDVLIMESTYGGVVRPNRKDLIDLFLRSIFEAEERKGNVLIPTFAFHRIQEMAVRIDSAMKAGQLPKYNTYCMSGLANKITQYFNENRDCFCEDIQERKAPFRYERIKTLRRMNEIREPAIVMCTSGFGHAGVSKQLLYQWADNENNSIIINTGYLPVESPLMMARDKRILEGEDGFFDVKANITQIELSGHADQAELIKFVDTIKPKKTFLVHGKLDQAEALQGKIDDVTEVIIPENHQSFTV
jgi:Cft2 family RNA processing exonuclease